MPHLFYRLDLQPYTWTHLHRDPGPISSVLLACLGRNIHPVIGGSMKLDNYDIVTIGSTKLMFVGLCGKDFNWGSEGKEHE